MKKIFVGIVIFTIGVALTTINSQPTSAVAAPDSCYTMSGGVVEAYSNNTECPKNLDIPSSIGGVTVTTIGAFAFIGNNLTSVTIPNTVTVIDAYAFSGNKLTSVTIPNSVTNIGPLAFEYNQLTSVTIPDSVVSIEYGSFGYNQLSSVTIPNSVTNIGPLAFINNQLTSITIPDSVTSIGDSAFAENRLTSLTIPTSVTSIGDFGFNGNNLQEVTVLGNPAIGDRVFGSNGSADETWSTAVANIVRVYATNSTFVEANPHALYDLSNNSSFIDGAFITNPASVSISYHNEAGEEVAPRYTTVDGEQDSSYALSRLMSTYDETTNSADFSSYLLEGATFALPIPEVAGYATPSARTVTLSAGLNEFTVVYASANETAPGSVSGNGDDSSVPGVPDTGVKQVGYSVASIAVLTIAAGALVAILRKRAE